MLAWNERRNCSRRKRSTGCCVQRSLSCRRITRTIDPRSGSAITQLLLAFCGLAGTALRRPLRHAALENCTPCSQKDSDSQYHCNERCPIAGRQGGERDERQQQSITQRGNSRPHPNSYHLPAGTVLFNAHQHPYRAEWPTSQLQIPPVELSPAHRRDAGALNRILQSQEAVLGGPPLLAPDHDGLA